MYLPVTKWWTFLYFFVIFAAVFTTVEATTAETSIRGKLNLVCIFVAMVLAQSDLYEDPIATGHSSPPIERKQRPVYTIFRELGPIYTRRAYRMHEDDFWVLHKILQKHLGGKVRPDKGSRKRHRNGAPNGLISSPTRLSVALRYFAGGSPYDIAIAHGISHTEVFESVWKVR